MTPEFHSAHANRAFDDLAHRVTGFLRADTSGVLGFDGDTVAARLAQRIVDLGLNGYAHLCAARLKRGETPVPSAGSTFSCGGLRLDAATGAARPSLWLVLRSFAEFVAHSALIVWNLLAGLVVSGERNARPATLLFGIGAESVFHNGSDARFAAFCRDGPVPPLAAADRLIVQFAPAQGSTEPQRIEYRRQPLLALARTWPLSAAQRIGLAVRYLALIAEFALAIARRPIMAILARDWAYAPLVRRLDRAGSIAAVVVTNSAYASQPLWMRARPGRCFRAHMVWYSQNTVPPVFRPDGLRSDLPNYRHMSVDEHWVWTQGYAKYLRELGVPGAVHVCGPILWYLPEPQAPAPAAAEIRIVVFDVTPVTDERALDIGLLYNYYSAVNMLRFVEETVAACEELSGVAKKRVRILFKHKRSYNRFHDPRYVNLIRGLSGPAGRIELVPFHANMYTLLRDSDLSIVVPYSSPAYVADHVGRPALFFDPTGELEPAFEPAPHIRFASGRAELLKLAREQVMQGRPS